MRLLHVNTNRLAVMVLQIASQSSATQMQDSTRRLYPTVTERIPRGPELAGLSLSGVIDAAQGRWSSSRWPDLGAIRQTFRDIPLPIVVVRNPDV